MPVVINGSTGVTTPNITAPTTALSSLNGGQLAGFRNKIINGKMDISQRKTSFAAPVTGTYTLDRWVQFNTTTGVYTISQAADAPADGEFQNSLRVTVTTADTAVAAGDISTVRQWIEGFNARDLIGRTFVLRFRVRSSKVGIHCASFKNTGADRSYVAEYTVNAPNTWEDKFVTVPAGLITAGTWNWTNGQGLAVDFALIAGSTFQAPAGSWQNGNFVATANQVNCLDTVGNIFAITGVQLEVGSIATPFEHRPIGQELLLCARYLPVACDGPGPICSAWAANATTAFAEIQFKVRARATPTSVVVISGGVAFVTYTSAGAAVEVLTAGINTAGVNGARLTLTTAGSLTAGQGSSFQANGQSLIYFEGSEL